MKMLSIVIKNDDFLSKHITGLIKSNNKLIFYIGGFQYNLRLNSNKNYVSKFFKAYIYKSLKVK